MIIGDQFAFLHIPKCGGTSVRTALAPWDTYKNAFWGKNVEPDGFHLDLAHMTPTMLRKRRPEVFAKIDRLPRYAILRDPADRLISSMNEHLENLYKTSIARIHPKRLPALVSELEQKLANMMDELPAELIHFAPQKQYVCLEGVPYVQNLYRLDDLERFRNDLNRDYGTAIKSIDRMRVKEGQGVKLRVPEHLVWRANRILWNHAPRPVHSLAKALGRSLLVSDGGTNTSEEFRASAAFNRLLDRYYAEDQILWQAACHRKKRGIEQPELLTRNST